MSENRRIIRLNRPDSLTNLKERSAACVYRAQVLGISMPPSFIRSMSDRYSVAVFDAETILDLVESEEPAVIVEQTDFGDFIRVVEPLGEFTWKGFTGNLLTVWFTKSGTVNLSREFPQGDREDVSCNRQDTLVNPGNWRNTAIYNGGRLGSLTYQVYNDSTSSFRLTTEFDPAAGVWRSHYTPAYGNTAGRVNEPLGPESRAVRYSISDDNRFIRLRAITIESSEDVQQLIVSIQHSETDEKVWDIDVSAPLRFPSHLFPADNVEGYLDWLEQNWNTAYPMLKQRERIINQRSARSSYTPAL